MTAGGGAPYDAPPPAVWLTGEGVSCDTCRAAGSGTMKPAAASSISAP